MDKQNGTVASAFVVLGHEADDPLDDGSLQGGKQDGLDESDQKAFDLVLGTTIGQSWYFLVSLLRFQMRRGARWMTR